MTKRATNVSGLLLLAIGGLALLHTSILPWMGWEFGLWRFWPLLVGMSGMVLVLVPLGSRQRGLQPLYIPGVPILVVGAMLLWSSLLNSWGLWSVFWPMILLGLAFGFFMTTIGMRIIWFLIPAIIIGVNGLMFQFCALTGWWESWAVLWTLEPLAVGLALLAVSGGRRGLLTAGLILTAVSAVSFSLMSFLLSGWLSTLAALALIGTGFLLLRRGNADEEGNVPLEKSPKEKLYDTA